MFRIARHGSHHSVYWGQSRDGGNGYWVRDPDRAFNYQTEREADYAAAGWGLRRYLVERDPKGPRIILTDATGKVVGRT